MLGKYFFKKYLHVFCYCFKLLFVPSFFVLVFLTSAFQANAQSYPEGLPNQNCTSTGREPRQNRDYIMWTCNTGFADSPSFETYYCHKKTNFCQNSVNSEITDEAPETEGCNFLMGATVKGCMASVFSTLFYYFFYFINWLLSSILQLASLVFNLSIYYSIVKFKSYFANFAAGEASRTAIGSTMPYGLVYYLWGMIRDFLNIIIFLTIIYHAVQSMFEGFASTRNKFISLLVFSIVVNFSLLFVKIAIDISNILALQAYTLAVKPSGTDKFSSFTKSNIQGAPSNYAEYIMDSVNYDQLINSSTGKLASEKQILESYKSTTLFQIGRMIVYVVLIYILLYMAGVLLMRGINFILAMILAPLIAVDVYFQIFAKGSEEVQKMLSSLRNFTKRIKENFYDSLIQGPVLIFGIFLIGVLADSILGKGAIAELTKELQGVKDVKSFDSLFIQNIFYLFKFLIFGILCFAIFKIVGKVSVSGAGGRFGVSNFGKSFANLLIGRGLGVASGVTGTIGRRVIGQGLAGGAIGQSLQNTFTRLQNPNSLISRVGGAAIGRAGNRAINSLKTGNYDLRQSTTATRLGGIIKNATGVDLSASLGKGPDKQGFEAINKSREDAAKTAQSDYIKSQQDKVELTDEEKKKINDDSKVDFAGGKFTAAEIAQAIKDAKDHPGEQIIIGAPGTKQITKSAGDEIFKIGEGGRSTADIAQASAEALIKKNQEIKKNDKKKEVEELIKMQTSTRGNSLLVKAKDSITGSTVNKSIRDDSNKYLTNKYESKMQSERIKGKNSSEQLALIKSNLSQNATSTIAAINDAVLQMNRLNITPEQRLVNTNKLNSLKGILQEFEGNVASYDTSKLSAFNKETLPDLIAAKQEALNTIISLYSTYGNQNLKDRAKDNGSLGRLKKSVITTENRYKGTLPKEEKKKVDEAKAPATPKS